MSREKVIGAQSSFCHNLFTNFSASEDVAYKTDPQIEIMLQKNKEMPQKYKKITPKI